MAKHIHIYLPAKTHDAVKHAPAGTSKGGQFVSGSGGGGGGSGAPSKKVNASSGPDEDKLRARVKAAREGMQAAGKNKAEYERHESQFEESTNALLKHQEKSKSGPKGQAVKSQTENSEPMSYNDALQHAVDNVADHTKSLMENRQKVMAFLEEQNELGANINEVSLWQKVMGRLLDKRDQSK